MDGKQLKNSILQWAIQGKLVPQNPKDEPAQKLLEKIRAEKDRLIKEGRIKKDKKESIIYRGDDNKHYEKIGHSDTKCIDDEIPFEEPAGWAWAKINNIAFVTKLAGFEYTEYIAENLQPTGIPLFKGKNVQNGKIIYHFEAYIPEKLSDELPRSQITKKCLLTPYVGTIGNIGIHNKEGKYHLGSNVGKIEVFNPEKETLIMEEYLHYYLMSSTGYSELTKYKKATAQESISIDAIRDVYVPIPPIKEQVKIVAKLEQVLPLAEEYGAAQEQLDKLNKELPEALKKSILQEAIQGKLVPQNPKDEPASVLLAKIRKEKETLVKQGKLKKKDLEITPIDDDEIPFEIPDSWTWCRLGDIVSKLVDGDHNPPSGIAKKTEYMMLSSRNINFDKLVDLDNVRYLDADVFAKENERTNATIGDVLFTSVGTIGRSCVLKENVNICFQRSVTIMTTYVYNEYLKRYFDSPFYQNYADEHAVGTAQRGFYLKEMEQSLIALPPLAEQKRIVAKLEQLFKEL
jgi:type I restriction enzyme S subunit